MLQRNISLFSFLLLVRFSFIEIYSVSYDFMKFNTCFNMSLFNGFFLCGSPDTSFTFSEIHVTFNAVVGKLYAMQHLTLYIISYLLQYNYYMEQYLLYYLFYDDVTINFSFCLLYVFCIQKSRFALNQVNSWFKTMLASLIICGILQWQCMEKQIAIVLKYIVATSETYRVA